MKHNLRGLLALSPVVVLLGVYLVGSLLIGDFYAIPIGAAFVVAAIYGIAITSGRSLQERIHLFSEGAAHRDILYMIWIFCLAGRILLVSSIFLRRVFIFLGGNNDE